jgi:hypothetical protein
MPSSVYAGPKAASAPTPPESSTPSLSFYATGAPGKNWEDLCRGPHVPSTSASAPHASCPSPPPTGTATKTPTASSASTAPPSPPRPNSTSTSSNSKRPPSATTASSARPSASSTSTRTVGQGLILWTPKGSVVRKELQTFIAAELKKQGYTEVFTPHIGSLDLYKTSGHFPYYKDSQFPPIVERDALDELSNPAAPAPRCCAASRASPSASPTASTSAPKQTIAKDRIMPDDQLVEGFMLKPMNCPHHAKIFGSAPTPTATCPSASPSSAPSIAGSSPANSTASPASAASPRTTPTSSAPKTRSPPKSRAASHSSRPSSTSSA